MKEMTANFLRLLYEPHETISVSHNKYGYHSIKQEDLNGPFVLVSPNEEIQPVTINETDINLISINPVNGFRRDENVIKFRSFMVEIDTGTLEEQKKYIEDSKLPYSACIFSGNKSLHYAIVLDEPLPSIAMWRFYNQWLLNVLKATDQQIKNPTRSIRFPGNKRKNGRQLVQALVSMGGRITQADFFRWLDSFADAKPVKREERLISGDIISGLPLLSKLPKDVTEHLERGVNESRNATWFYIGCRFAELGFDYNYTLSHLERYFEDQQSFGRREWIGCLKSAYKRINGENYV